MEDFYEAGSIMTINLENPLVVILGIGRYLHENINDLKGVSTDYCNIIYSCNYKHGYQICYYNKENELKHINEQIDTLDKINKIKHAVKLEWNSNDIIRFNQDIKNVLSMNEADYDSLIYFASSHGYTKETICDSTWRGIGKTGVCHVTHHMCICCRNFFNLGLSKKKRFL